MFRRVATAEPMANTYTFLNYHIDRRDFRWMRFNTLNQKNGCACVHCVGSDQLAALEDRERSPAILSSGFGGRWIRRHVATVEPKGIASNSMNGICSVEFRRRYATRFCFCGCQTRVEERVYARSPLSRQDSSALADFEGSPAIDRRVSMENECFVASRRLNRWPIPTPS